MTAAVDRSAPTFVNDLAVSYHELVAEAELLKLMFRVVAEARRVATRIGDSDAVWDLLAEAADLELDALNFELVLS